MILKIKDNFLLTLCVSSGVALLAFLPTINIIGFDTKKVNIFSSIVAEKQDTVQDLLTVNTAKSTVKAAKKISYNGAIEDYSGKGHGLDFFYKALKADVKSKAVRVAFFGDSFIEGDIMCGPLRDTLQGVFGGNGVGFVPITSDVAGFRTTINHSFESFESHNLVDNSHSNKLLAAGGYYFIPQPYNVLTYKPSKQYRRTSIFNNVKLFYKSETPSFFSVTTSDKTILDTLLDSTGIGFKKYALPNADKATFNFSYQNGTILYGCSFESNNGIYIDNFGLRGNSGLGLGSIPMQNQRQFGKLQDYKLIILQFGLNVLTDRDTNFKWYFPAMKKTIEAMKSAYPNASFLLVGVPDRDNKQDGSYKTLKNLPRFVEQQRQLAKDTKIAFWDMYSAMGGANSMATWVESTPMKANKDYTHINFNGGRAMASLLAKAILADKKKYDLQSQKNTTSDTLRLN